MGHADQNRRPGYVNLAPEWFPVMQDVRDRYFKAVPGVRLLDSPSGVNRPSHEAHRSHVPLLPPELHPTYPTRYMNVWWSGARPYQFEAAKFIRDRRGSLLADQMRLGKTLAALLAHNPSEGQLVVAAPLATRNVWLTWMRRLWPSLTPFVLKGRFVDDVDRWKLQRSPIVFCHYDILKHWESISSYDIGLLVLDEAHLLSKHKSQRWGATAFLETQARRVVALTGTPVWNRPEGVYNILSLLSPGAWGSYKKFTYRYCGGGPGAYGWETGLPTNTDEFKKRLSEVVLRRTWNDVRSDLPPITRSVEQVEITVEDTIAIEKQAETTRQTMSDRRATIGEVAHLRRMLGQLKWKHAVELAREVLRQGESVVVWTWHKEVAIKLVGLLEQEWLTFKIDGDASQAARDHELDLWRTTKVAPLVATMAVGQVGIDLSHARHAIFAEQDWTPSVIAQAEMRTYSPDRPMSITHVIADFWLDRQIVNKLLAKCRAADAMGLVAADTSLDDLFQDEELPNDTLDLVDWLIS